MEPDLDAIYGTTGGPNSIDLSAAYGEPAAVPGAPAAVADQGTNSPSLWDTIQQGIMNFGNSKVAGNMMQNAMAPQQQPRAIPTLNAGQAPVHTPSGQQQSLIQLIFGNAGMGR